MLRSLSLFSIFTLACTAGAVGRVPVDAAAPVDDAGTPALAHAPIPSTMGDALVAAGLDPANLPSLDALDDTQRDAVMQTFDDALGLQCGDCHEADPSLPTRRTRIAGKMWDQFVRGLRFSDGSAIYCDSCHQGALTFLDRRDLSPTGLLAAWMGAAYVTPLARSDGNAHSCATCHGDPYVGRFLDGWGADPPAPDDGGAPADLGPDMATLGCGRLVACIDDCDGDTRCGGECKAHAPVAAKQLLQAADACALAACKKDGRCTSATDDSDDCNLCFSNASAGGVTGVACAPEDDVDCGDCSAEWQACESD